VRLIERGHRPALSSTFSFSLAQIPLVAATATHARCVFLLASAVWVAGRCACGLHPLAAAPQWRVRRFLCDVRSDTVVAWGRVSLWWTGWVRELIRIARRVCRHTMAEEVEKKVGENVAVEEGSDSSDSDDEIPDLQVCACVCVCVCVCVPACLCVCACACLCVSVDVYSPEHTDGISCKSTWQNSADDAGDSEDAKQSRNEKKARKALIKLGLKPVEGVTRVVIKKAKMVRRPCRALSLSLSLSVFLPACVHR
jgi:hypothetical protein